MRHRADTDAPVLHVTDELDMSTTPLLRRCVQAVLAARPQTLVLDLSECPFAGVDAVETLVALTADARRRGTTLVLVGMRPVVRRAVTVLGLEDRLNIGKAPRPRGHAET